MKDPSFEEEGMSRIRMNEQGKADLLQVDAMNAALVPHASLPRARDRQLFDRR